MFTIMESSSPIECRLSHFHDHGQKRLHALRKCPWSWKTLFRAPHWTYHLPL